MGEKKPQVSYIYIYTGEYKSYMAGGKISLNNIFLILIILLGKTERNNLKCPAMINPMKVLYCDLWT